MSQVNASDKPGGEATGAAGQASPGAETPRELILEPVDGPGLDAISISAAQPVTLGRGHQADVLLSDPAVSRVHATVMRKGRRWFIIDQDSRHGVTINGAPIEPQAAVPIAHRDLIRIGPWTLLANTGDAAADTSAEGLVAAAVSAEEGGRVETVDRPVLDSSAQRRLDLLIRCAADMYAAPDEPALARHVAAAAALGSGFRRAAILRDLSPRASADEPDDGPALARLGVVALHVAGTPETTTHEASRVIHVSRGLIQAASRGKPVRLSAEDGRATDISSTGASSRLHAALCIPVSLDGRVAQYLYLDAGEPASGDNDTTTHAPPAASGDAAGFCTGLARLYGFALAGLRARAVTLRNLALEEQMASAREAQQLIVPPATGVVGGLKYTLVMRPGLVVAGDLFDIVDLGPGRVAVFLGDVTGEGVGAGIMMASAQSFLHAKLTETRCPAAAVNAANDYLADHSPHNRFVSLWVGLFDRNAGTLEYVDAGHGHFLLVKDRGLPHTLRVGGGIPAAIEPNMRYEASTTDFSGRDRLVLFSDGVVEQTGPAGDMFGLDETIQTVAGSGSVERDAQMLLAAVLFHAGREQLDDDTTIASIQWTP